MQVEIPIGHKVLPAILPDGQVAGVCTPGALTRASDPAALARDRVAAGLAAAGIAARAAAPHARACIVVTDRTRSTPLGLIVPILLDQLNALGVPDDRITIISGGGMHAPDTGPDLLRTLGPAVLDRVQACTDEPDNDAAMIGLGTTALGTAVELHRRFVEADIRIGVTNVTPCMLAGWSGGGKIVLPGVASRRTIYQNHRHFVGALAALRCASLMGVMPPDNLVRADIEETATIAKIDMVVNTVLDRRQQLVDLFCGDQVTAQRAAVARMAPQVEVSLPERVDLLIAGVGDPALEVSLFQGGSRVCGGADRYLKPGGTLVMVNACEEGIYEGFEHEGYREWMRCMPVPAEIGRLVADGAMGGEKGCVLYTFAWLLREMRCRIIVVTGGMTRAELKDVHLDHAATVQEAVDEALASYNRPSIGVMPYGGLVLPVLPVRPFAG